MFSAFQTFGRLGAGARAVSAAWSPLALWPDGAATPGLWISPRSLTSQWQNSTGTTPVSAPGTVADTSNPVGLALDIRAGATALADPGNHMLQSTSPARPLLSARVNQLTFTEDFSNGVWLVLSGLVQTPNYALAPDGSMTACRLYAPSGAGVSYGGGVWNTQFARSVWIKSNTGSDYTVTWGSGNTSVAGATWARVSDIASANDYQWDLNIPSGGDVSIWHPQYERGTVATDYQSIPGDGSTYATNFPIAQLYDGVDDGMATAAFAAGTLTSGMDCMIAVRRDLAGSSAVCGLHRMEGSNQFIAAADPGQGWPATSGAGSPTTWVDGAQLAGGTATSAGTLHTALTVGDWHILELRGLDLSAWTSLCFGWYGSNYNLNGARGDILLFPSTTPTADKDAARQWLADYYGVTLA